MDFLHDLKMFDALDGQESEFLESADIDDHIKSTPEIHNPSGLNIEILIYTLVNAVI